ncbi:unnamed protein product, partial [Discosporangium mesarthrocarpum]
MRTVSHAIDRHFGHMLACTLLRLSAAAPLAFTHILPNILFRGPSLRRMSHLSSTGEDTSTTSAVIPSDVHSLLEALYASPKPPKLCVSTTGSGGQAIAWMLGVPGASSCLLEASVPYSTASTDEKTGGIGGGYCSQAAADALARDAYNRAVSLCVSDSPDLGPCALSISMIVGLGCTASVVSSRPKHGLHRCYVAAHTHKGVNRYYLEMAKGQRDRVNEDAAVSRVMILAMAEAAGIPIPPAFPRNGLLNVESLVGHQPLLDGNGAPQTTPEAVESTQEGMLQPAVEGQTELWADPVESLVAGDTEAVFLIPGGEPEAEAKASSAVAAVSTHVTISDGAVKAAIKPGTVVFPGSYNPLHRGHMRLMEAACSLHARRVLGDGHQGGAGAGGRGGGGVRAVFEVSVSNADKGVLSVGEIRARVAQFIDRAGTGWPFPLALTRAPLFKDKARLFPGCAFVVGADTAKRIVNPKYYNNSTV